MTAPQAAKFFRQWVRLIEKYSRARAIMQAGIKRDIISAPSPSCRKNPRAWRHIHGAHKVWTNRGTGDGGQCIPSAQSGVYQSRDERPGDYERGENQGEYLQTATTCPESSGAKPLNEGTPTQRDEELYDKSAGDTNQRTKSRRSNTQKAACGYLPHCYPLCSGFSCGVFPYRFSTCSH